ncbi:uncharacterized protein LOC126682746 [Mercurialis annua]|uniref:uncharacterized protein LOC126682746 n=1 Tax=Mercurialis annua TaxID=3986 RepID=UPI00215FBC48|nr:uncharacterized protein LOC126682746 [Mercurialis annua]
MVSKSRSLHNLRIVTDSSYSEASIQQVNNQNGSNASSQSQPVEPESCQPIVDTCTEMIDNDGRRFKKRGRTTMSSVWNMEKDEKIYVEVDEFGVPCSREGATLGSFLGTIALNGKYAPLDMPRWDSKDYKSFRDDILTLVQEKFLIPPETKRWVLESVGKKWRDYKSDLKLQHFSRNKPKDQVLTNVPKGVEAAQWRILVNGWYTEQSQKVSQINTANANKKKNKQTTGRKSYARLRKEMEIQNGKAPDRLTFYEKTHKKKDGTYIDDNSKELMDKAKKLREEHSEGSSTNLAKVNEEIFQELMGPEHNGRVRGLGSGVTPIKYFGPTRYDVGGRCHNTTNVCQSEEVKDLKEQLHNMSKTVDALKAFINKQFPGQWTSTGVDNHQDGHSSS